MELLRRWETLLFSCVIENTCHWQRRWFIIKTSLHYPPTEFVCQKHEILWRNGHCHWIHQFHLISWPRPSSFSSAVVRDEWWAWWPGLLQTSNTYTTKPTYYALNAHLKLHSSQLRQKSQHPRHPLHKFTVLTENERHKKQTIFDNNNNYTVNINTKPDLICEDLIQSNLKLIHSHIVSNHLSQRPPNKVLQDQTPSVSPAELLLSRETRRTLAQLRTNKSPLLVSHLFSIGDPRHPSPLCPLCLMHDHTSSHLFECKSLPTSLSSLDLWTNPDKVEPFLATWGERLLAATWFRVLDSAGSTLVEWGRQQQQQQPGLLTEVRWISWGRMLKRFFDLRDEIKLLWSIG